MSDKVPAPAVKDRPFPWPCVECHAKSVFPVVTDYTTTVKHDSRSYTISVPDLIIPTCRKCGDQLITADADERIRDALRARVGLLTSAEIRAHRTDLGLSQQELADAIGAAKETICRWETGAIQSRAMDNLLRLYFTSDEARGLLHRRFQTREAAPA